MPKSRRSPERREYPKRDVNAAQRATIAVGLRAKGLTYAEIYPQAGYANESSCRKAIARELDRVIVTNVDELRNTECYRLDKLLTAVWPYAVPDDTTKKPDLFAVDRVLRIIESRRQLMGIDKPVASDGSGAQVVVRELPPGYLGGTSS